MKFQRHVSQRVGCLLLFILFFSFVFFVFIVIFCFLLVIVYLTLFFFYLFCFILSQKGLQGRFSDVELLACGLLFIVVDLCIYNNIIAFWEQKGNQMLLFMYFCDFLFVCLLFISWGKSRKSSICFVHNSMVGWSLGSLVNGNSACDKVDSQDYLVDCSFPFGSSRGHVFAFVEFPFGPCRSELY